MQYQQQREREKAHFGATRREANPRKPASAPTPKTAQPLTSCEATRGVAIYNVARVTRLELAASSVTG